MKKPLTIDLTPEYFGYRRQTRQAVTLDLTSGFHKNEVQHLDLISKTAFNIENV